MKPRTSSASAAPNAPDCADAYVVLSEGSDSGPAALELLRQAVSAGERSIGEKRFREEAGHFWGAPGTRPYMRARAALAKVLWLLDCRAEAIGHYRDMLRLNPDDNQGLRFELAGWLAETGDFPGLAGLLIRFRDDESAGLDYARALLEYHVSGDSDKARRALEEAFSDNDLAPDILLGRRRTDTCIPDGYSPGSEEEAIILCRDLGAAWLNEPNALEWLAQRWDANLRAK